MLLCLAALLAVTPAHSWYDQACCSERACYPISADEVEALPNGDWRVKATGDLFSGPHGSPTGGDKGVGTINANDLYNDSVTVTCMALANEFRESGEIDIAKWDEFIPDVVIPAHEIDEPVMEDITLEYNSRTIDKDGDTVLVKKSKPWKRHVTEWHCVYDEHGNGIEAFERPVYCKIVQPETVTKRQHGIARLFKKMCDEGFDPRDPSKYIAS